MKLHRKVKLHLGFMYLMLFITYLAPFIPNGRLAFTIQQLSFPLFLGFMVAFFASLVYYHADSEGTESEPI